MEPSGVRTPSPVTIDYNSEEAGTPVDRVQSGPAPETAPSAAELDELLSLAEELVNGQSGPQEAAADTCSSRASQASGKSGPGAGAGAGPAPAELELHCLLDQRSDSPPTAGNLRLRCLVTGPGGPWLQDSPPAPPSCSSSSSGKRPPSTPDRAPSCHPSAAAVSQMYRAAESIWEAELSVLSSPDDYCPAQPQSPSPQLANLRDYPPSPASDPPTSPSCGRQGRKAGHSQGLESGPGQSAWPSTGARAGTGSLGGYDRDPGYGLGSSYGLEACRDVGPDYRMGSDYSVRPTGSMWPSRGLEPDYSLGPGRSLGPSQGQDLDCGLRPDYRPGPTRGMGPNYGLGPSRDLEPDYGLGPSRGMGPSRALEPDYGRGSAYNAEACDWTKTQDSGAEGQLTAPSVSAPTPTSTPPPTGPPPPHSANPMPMADPDLDPNARSSLTPSLGPASSSGPPSSFGSTRSWDKTLDPHPAHSPRPPGSPIIHPASSPTPTMTSGLVPAQGSRSASIPSHNPVPGLGSQSIGRSASIPSRGSLTTQSRAASLASSRDPNRSTAPNSPATQSRASVHASPGLDPNRAPSGPSPYRSPAPSSPATQSQASVVTSPNPNRNPAPSNHGQSQHEAPLPEEGSISSGPGSNSSPEITPPSVEIEPFPLGQSGMPFLRRSDAGLVSMPPPSPRTQSTTPTSSTTRPPGEREPSVRHGRPPDPFNMQPID